MANNNPQNAARRGDITHNLRIKLDEAATGKVELVRVPRLDMCDACNGTGESWREEDGGCRNCENEGWITLPKYLEVRIPAGVHDGTRLRIAGEGELDPANLVRGDLYILVGVLKHERFERRGKHLYTYITLRRDQMKVGTELLVPTLLDGSKSLRIPPGTANGTLFRLGGLGLRSIESSERGDLFVKVEEPTSYDTRNKTAWTSTASPQTPPNRGSRWFSSKRARLLIVTGVVLAALSPIIVRKLNDSQRDAPNENVNSQPAPYGTPTSRREIPSPPTPMPTPERTPFSPPNGSNITPPQGPRGNSYLIIVNGTSFDVAVKLVSSSTQKTRRFFYVRANSTARVNNVAFEMCVLRIMSGTDWDKSARRFSYVSSIYEFDQPFDFRRNAHRVYLSPSVEGTLKDIPINEAEFEDK